MSPNCRLLFASLSPRARSSLTWARTSATCHSCWQKPPGRAGKVFAFEALPSNVDQLRRNVALNAMEKRVMVIDRAVTRATSPVRFLVHASGGMGERSRVGRARGQVRIRSQRPWNFAGRIRLRPGQPAATGGQDGHRGRRSAGAAGYATGISRITPAYADGTAWTRVARRATWENAYRCRLRDLLDAPRIPGGPCAEALGWKAYIVAKPLPRTRGR